MKSFPDHDLKESYKLKSIPLDNQPKNSIPYNKENYPHIQIQF